MCVFNSNQQDPSSGGEQTNQVNHKQALALLEARLDQVETELEKNSAAIYQIQSVSNGSTPSDAERLSVLEESVKLQSRGICTLIKMAKVLAEEISNSNHPPTRK